MQSEYRVKRIYTEEDGGVVAKCYDILYGEDFEKYLGYPDDFDGKENASNLLQDSTYEMSDELRAEIEELFNVSEFNDEQDYDGYQFYDFEDEEYLDDDFDDEKALALLGRDKRESFNLREALNQIDIDTDNKYDLLNLYESCDLKENEKRVLANIVYDQEDPRVIYDTLNNRYVSGEEIEESKSTDDEINGRIMEFPNGDYFYVNKTGNTLSLGSATNNGFISEYEIDYDDDLSLDMNLQNLYDYALESNPQLMNESDELNEDHRADIMTFSQWFDKNSVNRSKEFYPFDNYVKVFENAEVLRDATAEDIRDNAHQFYNIYDVDSADREKAFRFASELLGLDYNTLYDAWLTGVPISDTNLEESSEETPYTKEEIEIDLKSITHNFTDKEGELKCGFEEEKNFAVEILKQHYKVVETSGDDRRDDTWYHISFAEPIEK